MVTATSEQTALDQCVGMAADAAQRLQAAGVRFKSARAEDDKPARPWFAFKNLARVQDGDTTAQIDIYDEIDWLWGVTSRDFRDQLNALPDSVDTIDLHVNSPGGDVYEAIAIMNSLRQHSAKVVTTVDGYAASSAGFIAVGASDELIMAENSELMAHLPWAIMIGDSADMRKMADDLDRIGRNIASIFMARAGGKLDDWLAILTDETWWSADEAVEAGIADSVMKAPKRKDAKDAARNRFNLSVFNHAGRSNASAPRNPQVHNETPQPDEGEAEKGKEPTVATLSESALQKLGLDADADEATIDAKIDETIAAAEKEPEQAPAEPTADDVAKVAAKFGLTVMDKAVAEQMRADAAAGAEARAQQVREANETTIQNALREGCIAPASTQTWRDELAKNPDGVKALLESMPRNSAVPVDGIGHGVSREDMPEDAELAGVFAHVTGTSFGKDA